MNSAFWNSINTTFIIKYSVYNSIFYKYCGEYCRLCTVLNIQTKTEPSFGSVRNIYIMHIESLCMSVLDKKYSARYQSKFVWYEWRLDHMYKIYNRRCRKMKLSFVKYRFIWRVIWLYWDHITSEFALFLLTKSYCGNSISLMSICF